MQETWLIRYTLVLFVCLFVEEVIREMREIKWCFWGSPRLLFLSQAGQLRAAFPQTLALLLPVSPRLASSEAPSLLAIFSKERDETCNRKKPM